MVKGYKEDTTWLWDIVGEAQHQLGVAERHGGLFARALEKVLFSSPINAEVGFLTVQNR